MGRLIDRQAALDALDKVAQMFPYRIPGNAKTYRQYNEAWNDAIDAAETAVEALPPVDAVPVQHGRWIERGYMGNDNWDYMCSFCGAGEVHTKRVEVRYCWNCGARMDGDHAEGTIQKERS